MEGPVCLVIIGKCPGFCFVQIFHICIHESVQVLIKRSDHPKYAIQCLRQLELVRLNDHLISGHVETGSTIPVTSVLILYFS